jgi:hypothetical protein
MQSVNREKTQEELDSEIPHDSDHTEGTDHNPAAPEQPTETAPQAEAPKTIGEHVTAPTTIVSPC